MRLWRKTVHAINAIKNLFRKEEANRQIYLSLYGLDGAPCESVTSNWLLVTN